MILGLDMSTKKTGFGLLNSDGDLVTYGLIRTTENDIRRRMEEIYNGIEDIIVSNDVQIIVIEDVPVNTHSNIKTGKDLAVLQGVILGLCFKHGLPFHFYNPSAWRSIIGTYNGTREGMKREYQKQKAVEEVNLLYDLDFIYNATETKTRLTDDDKAEAILIALAYIKDKGKE